MDSRIQSRASTPTSIASSAGNSTSSESSLTSKQVALRETIGELTAKTLKEIETASNNPDYVARTKLLVAIQQNYDQELKDIHHKKANVFKRVFVKNNEPQNMEILRESKEASHRLVYKALAQANDPTSKELSQAVYDLVETLNDIITQQPLLASNKARLDLITKQLMPQQFGDKGKHFISSLSWLFDIISAVKNTNPESIETIDTHLAPVLEELQKIKDDTTIDPKDPKKILAAYVLEMKSMKEKISHKRKEL